MLELRYGRQKPPSVATPTASSSCASMPAGAASRYALGAGGMGAARPAPAASLISASRYALGARRTALRAEGAARLCARRHSRWLPSPPRATRSAPIWRAAPGAWAPIRQPGRGLALRARHQRRIGAARPSAHMCSPGCGRCLLGMVGIMQRRRALRFALLETLGATRASRSCRGRGWGVGLEGGLRHHHAQVCGGTLACYRSMCSVSRRGAPLQPERPTTRPGRPPAL